MQSVSSGYISALESSPRVWSWKIYIDWARNATEPLPESTTASNSLDSTNLPATDLVLGIGESVPYAVCDHNCLANGLWSPFPFFGEGYNRGWWSSSKSDASGQFSSPPYVEIIYTTGNSFRKANIIRVASTRYYSRVSSIRIYYMRSSDSLYQLLGTYELNTYYIEADLPDTYLLKRVKVEVLSTLNPNDYARLTEIDAIWRETIEDDRIKSITINKRGEHYLSTAVPYGIAAASDLSLEITDDDGEFGEGGIYNSYLRPNIRISVYLGLRVSGSFEWLQQGVYYAEADGWERSSTKSIRIRARDNMSLFQNMQCSPNLEISISADNLIKKLATRGHVNLNDMALTSISGTYDYVFVEGDTIYKSLNDCAQSLLINYWFDETGKFIGRSKSYFPSSIAILDDSDLRAISVSFAERANYVEYETSKLVTSENQLIGDWEDEDGLIIAPGQTITLKEEFSKSPILHVTSADYYISDDIDVVYITSAYEWLLIAANNGSANGAIWNVSFQGMPLSKYDKTYISCDIESMRRDQMRRMNISSKISGLTASEGQAIADNILNYVKDGAMEISATIAPRPHWQIGDMITINSSRLDISGNYILSEISLSGSSQSVIDMRIRGIKR